MREALELWRELGAPARELDIHLQVANLAMRWRDLALAQEPIDAAGQLAQWATPVNEAMMWEHRAGLASMTGNAQAAVEAYERAAARYR